MRKKKKNNSVLKDIAKLRGTQEEIARAAGIAEPTLRIYLNNPKKMNGSSRAKLAKALNMQIETMDDIVNGMIRSAEDFFAMKSAVDA